MLKKLIVIIVLLAAAYIGGSYYVGLRAEQQLVALMNDARARAGDELAWEQVDIKRGVFTSTGSMVLVLKEIKLDSELPVQTRISYTIHHHLTWKHLAHFVWSITPDQALASKLTSFYPKTPSLTGDGALSWSGVATSSIAFPGIDNGRLNNGALTVAPLTGSLTAGQNRFEMKVGVADMTLTEAGSPERLQLKDLAYEARSDDVTSGSVSATLWLADALLIGEDGVAETLSGYRWHFDVNYQNDILNFDTQKTIASVTAMGNQATNVEVSFGIDGLHRSDLQALAELVDEVNGQWLDINERQQDLAQQLVMRMLAKGLAIEVPAIKADVKLAGEQAPFSGGMQGLSFNIQVTDPKLAIGRLSIALASLKVPEMFQGVVPEVEGFKLEMANVLTDGHVEFTVRKSLARFAQDGQIVRDVEVDMGLSGLTPEGLLELVDIAGDLYGDFSELSAEQHARLAQIMQDASRHGLVFAVPVFKGTADLGLGQTDSLLLEGLKLEVKLDDAETGAGKASFVIGNLAAAGKQMAGLPSLKNYRLAVVNEVVNGKADYRVDKSIEALDSSIVKLGPSEISIRLAGLSAVDLQRLSELAPAFEVGLDQAQTAEVAQIIRRAIASGFALSIPQLQLLIDDATINGRGEVSLTGLGQAPLASFDLSRLAQMQAELTVNGQSALIEPWVQQGLMMGLLSRDNQVAKGQYEFKDGQLLLNGMAVPAGEFMLMANLMVQQMLAQHLGQADGSQGNDAGAATRHRRSPNN
ncbi:MAG: YdgA family protein [Burkholderiaceae bacterium]|nr:YdgA family protein [Burkholderiaceae bacterium]MCD8517867.1 YdgA family protein [Burkholderiaceae bacterium]